MTVTLLIGDCRKVFRTLEPESVHCVVTSPPYFGLRDYGVAGQIGLEPTPVEFIAEMVAVFREVHRVLRDDGTLWLNLGDSYNNFRASKGPGQAVHGRDKLNGKPAPDSGGRGWRGLKEKDLLGIPWRVAFALQADGWYLRQDIIWSKPNPMPESVRDRCTKAHEYLFLLSKSERYHYDADAIAEEAACPEGPGNIRPYRVAGERTGENANLGGNVHKIGPRETRNKRSVWEVTTAPFADAHFATFPPALIEPCILAGCPKGGTVLDPFRRCGHHRAGRRPARAQCAADRTQSGLRSHGRAPDKERCPAIRGRGRILTAPANPGAPVSQRGRIIAFGRWRQRAA